MSQTPARRPSVVTVRKTLFAPATGRAAVRSTIVRAKPFVDTEAIADGARQAAQIALTSSEKAAKSGLASGLRFMQFLRAYMKAFAVGFGSFLLLTELALGHTNILAMIGMHLFSVVAAPFYALVLAPAVFAMFRSLAGTGLQSAHRAYAVASSIGLLMLLERVLSGTFIVASDGKADLFAIAVTVSGVIAAYTFNRAVDRIETAERPA